VFFLGVNVVWVFSKVCTRNRDREVVG